MNPSPLAVSPQTELLRKRLFWKRMLWVSIALTIVFPLIGLLGTIRGMTHAFDALGESGAGDTTKLSSSIGESLTTTSAGLLGATIFLIFVIISAARLYSLPKPPVA